MYDGFERGVNGDDIGGAWTSSGAGQVVISTDHAYAGTRSAKILGSASIYNAYVNHPDGTGYEISFRIWKENASNAIMSHGNGTKCVRIYLRSDEVIYDANLNALGNMSADQWQYIQIKSINWAAGSFAVYLNGAFLANGQTKNSASHENMIIFYDETSGVGNDFYIDEFYSITPNAIGGAVSTAGALKQNYNVRFSGALAIAGSIKETIAMKIGGTVSSAASIMASIGMKLSGTVASAGNIKNTISVLFGGSVGMAGTIKQGFSILLSGVTAIAGDIATVLTTPMVLYQIVGGAVSIAGQVATGFLISVGGSIAIAGSVVTSRARLLFAFISKAVHRMFSPGITYYATTESVGIYRQITQANKQYYTHEQSVGIYRQFEEAK